MNFYPFHIGDYLSHTLHLSNEEDLAYRRMIDLYYMTEQPFNDCSTVAKRTRVSVQTAQLILDEFFEFCDDQCWHHKRIDEEIAKYKNKQTQAVRAGKASGTARRNARSTDAEPTKNQEPITNNQKPRTKSQDCQPTAHESKRQHAKALPTVKTLGEGTAVWEAYSQAYLQRYHTLPVRNARTNALCQQLVVRLGGEDAPHVAAFFVQHSNGFYVTKGHALAVLLGDAEKVRTEWITGRRITHTAAQQADRTQTTGDVFRELKTELNQRSAL